MRILPIILFVLFLAPAALASSYGEMGRRSFMSAVPFQCKPSRYSEDCMLYITKQPKRNRSLKRSITMYKFTADRVTFRAKASAKTRRLLSLKVSW
jgi:hypothetical protein